MFPWRRERIRQVEQMDRNKSQSSIFNAITGQVCCLYIALNILSECYNHPFLIHFLYNTHHH